VITMSTKKQYLGTKAVGIAKENIGKSLLTVVGGLVGFLLAGAVHATATIEGIEFSARPGSKFEIRLDFSEAPPEMKSYTIEKPARIAIDFPDTVSGLERKRYSLPYGNATGVVVLESGGRTRMVVNLSEFMQSYWWLVFGIIAGAGVGFVQGKRRSRKFGRVLDRMVLKLPIIGPIMHKAAVARYARTLSTMFAAGVPLVEALQSVAGATGNVVYSDAVLMIRDSVATGQQLTFAMNQTGLFPNMVEQMVAIGEESGSLDAMLAKVADFYEQEVDDAVDALSSLLEPLIMSILGILIGGLVVAMYLPIFKMGAAI